MSQLSASGSALLLCHGYTLEPVHGPPWADIVVGNSKQRHAGRITTALSILRDQTASGSSVQFILGTGATQDTMGLPFGDERNLRRAQDARDYQRIALALLRSDSGHYDLDPAWVEPVMLNAILDSVSMTTRDELLLAKTLYESTPTIQSLYLVSSPEHIARCHQTALEVFSDLPIRIYATAAQTRLSASEVISTTILEGVHRTDDDDYGLPEHLQRHMLARRLFFNRLLSTLEARQHLEDWMENWCSRQGD